MFYFAGIDATQGGIGRTSNRRRNDSDDFAIATLRGDETGPAELVNLDRHTGLTANQQSGIIHRKHAAFRYEYLMMDPNGGGISVRDELRQPVQDMGDGTFHVTPLITRDDDQMAGVGEAKLVLFGRYDSRIVGDKRDRFCPGCGLVLKSESLLPNKMHELFRGALESPIPKIKFPAKWHGWGKQTFSNANAMRFYLNELPGLSGADKAAAEIDLALAQLIQVDRVMNEDMVTVYQNADGFYEFTSSQKKDAAYALVYAYFAFWLWRTEREILRRMAKPKTERVFMVDEV